MQTRRTNLTTASRQWSERPADQRFWTLDDLFQRTKTYAQESKVKNLALSQCKVLATPDDNLVLAGPAGGQAEFQHYSFGQLANICAAPASYLRSLPAELAAGCLNNGMKNIHGIQSLMFHQNGGLHLRCVTSDRYERIWNHEVAELALALQENEGWVTPPARPCGLDNVPERIATEQDVLRHSAHKSLGIKVGDTISPAGLYASDHDCFIFQVNEDIQIDAGGGEMLYRGVFWSNSEVGDARFRGTMFLYDTICGNHIVWGAKVLKEISIRHMGEPARRFREAMAEATAMMRGSAFEDQKRIQAAKQKVLGPDKDKVINVAYTLLSPNLSKSQCEDAYVLAVRHADDHGNDPHTAWGYAAGITRLSQSKYADTRDKMDRAAGKLLEVAF